MKLSLTALMLFASAGSALAEERQPFESATLAGSILQTLAALGVVVGLILLFYYVSNRLLKAGLPAGSSAKYIRLLETKFIAPKKSLLLVEVGGEYLLLSSSGDALNFIKQIDMLEEIEVLDSPMFGKMGGAHLQSKIIDLVSRLPKRQTTGEPGRAAGGKTA